MDSIAKVLAELYRSDTNRSCVVTAREFRLAVQTVGLSFDDPVVQDNIVAFCEIDDKGNVHFEDVVRRVSVGDLPGNRGVSAFGAGVAAAAAASASGAEGSTEAESQAEVLQMFRQTVKERGARGIIGLGRIFKLVDANHSRFLSFEEFKTGMYQFGMDIGGREMKMLFQAIDKNSNGEIDYEEFISAVRGPMNDRRRKMVQQAFRVFDRSGDGVVNLDDLKGFYNGKLHPDVLAGNKSEVEVLQDFLDCFDVGDHDGTVTLQEFESYYSSISNGIDNDDYFELVIRNAWHITGGKGACENTSNRRVLVTHRVGGHQTVEEIKDDMGIGAHETQKMIYALKKQGIDAIKVELYM